MGGRQEIIVGKNPKPHPKQQNEALGEVLENRCLDAERENQIIRLVFMFNEEYN